jgi:hypothetical protein
MLTLFLFLCFLPLGNDPAEQHDYMSYARKYQGNYVNGDYRYAVTIPSGLVGAGGDAHAPDHGFRIDFSDDSDYILVDGSFDVLEFDDPPIPEGFTVLETRQTKTKLGGIDAVNVWRSMKNQSNGILYILIDVRTKRHIRDIRYSVTLHAPEKYFRERANVLYSIVDSFVCLKKKGEAN